MNVEKILADFKAGKSISVKDKSELQKAINIIKGQIGEQLLAPVPASELEAIRAAREKRDRRKDRNALNHFNEFVATHDGKTSHERVKIAVEAAKRLGKL